MTQRPLSMALIACFAFGCGGEGSSPQPAKTKPSQASTPIAVSDSAQSTPAKATKTTQINDACQDITIQMPFDVMQIPKDREADLQNLVNCLAKSPDAKVTVEGHIRVRGTSEFAYALSERMADSLGKKLQILGLNEQRITTISYGHDRPVCTEQRPECDLKNHRVEIRLEDD